MRHLLVLPNLRDIFFPVKCIFLLWLLFLWYLTKLYLLINNLTDKTSQLLYDSHELIIEASVWNIDCRHLPMFIGKLPSIMKQFTRIIPGNHTLRWLDNQWNYYSKIMRWKWINKQKFNLIWGESFVIFTDHFNNFSKLTHFLAAGWTEEKKDLEAGPDR